MTDLPDPFPRELIDTWPLHDARQELLEEIVSQPEQSPSTRRLIVPVGIAAALLLVVGGAWVAVSGGDNDRKDDTSVAASVDPTATEPTTAPTTAPASETSAPPERPRHQKRDRDVRVSGVEVGRVVTLQRCLRALRDSARPGDALRLRRLTEGKGDLRFYLVRRDRRVVAIDENCRVIRVDGGRAGRH